MKLFGEDTPKWVFHLLVLTIVAMVLTVLVSSARATDWRTPAWYPEKQDSIKGYLLTEAGDTVATGHTATDTNNYDTTWSVNDDTSYTVMLQNWANNEDLYSTWSWVRAANTLPSGTGPHAVTVYTVDTTGTDTILPQTYVSVKDTTGKVIFGGHNIITGNDALWTFYLNTGYYTFIAEKSMYTFDDSAFEVSADVDTLQLSAQNVSSSAKRAAVTVVVVASDGTPFEGAMVSAYLAATGIVDSLGRAVVSSIQRDRTDASGEAQFTCLWSSYMIPATEWIFTVHKPVIGGVSESVTIPDSSTYTINFLTM